MVVALMDEAGVTLPQVLLMSRVEQAGSASLSDLAQNSAASPAALSQMVERLVRQDLLARSEDPIDRRRKSIRITRRARALLKTLEQARSADYERGLDSLDAKLLARLAALLGEAIDKIEGVRATVLDRNSDTLDGRGASR
jgi:DNA-binding MarR family transcriptional regulator